MNRRTLALLLIYACILSAFTIAQERNAPGHGTLGILIITREGMVLAADSRVTYSNSYYDDHAVKIFKLGEHSACMLAGRVIQLPANGAFGFNLPRQIEIISRNPSLLGDVGTYTFQIQNDLASAIDLGSTKVPAADFFEDDPKIASVMVAGYSLQKGGPPSNIPDRYMAEASKIEYLSRPTPDIAGHGMFHRTYSVPVRQYQVLEVDGPGPLPSSPMVTTTC